MVTVIVNGRITENGRLEVDLPDDLPNGEVRVILEFPDEPTFSDEELKELLKVEPKSGAEIAAGLGEGNVWENAGIEDGAEWVENLRRKRREHLRW